MPQSVLIVEDEPVLQKALVRFFEKRSYEVTAGSNGQDGLAFLEKKPFDLLLADLMLPDISGIDLIRRGREIQPSLVSLVMTGYGTIASAVEAIKAGAFHYITKPFELEDLYSLVTKALELRYLRQENKALRQELKKKFLPENIIGKSKKMQEIFTLLRRVSESDSTVLILGESGTGKELLAKAIHYSSRRSDRPLVTINCAAIPETLLESELFGHVKGAFTGAIQTHQGRFEEANGGTVFLDEIGDMSPRLQVKVLRVLQDHRFEPVGSNKTREVDVRIITATNKDLVQAVKEGTFREDLFYRLNVIPITLPPLRERKSDIPLLIHHFLNKINGENKKNIAGFESEAMDCLMEYAWPGNVRELENLVERLTILKGEGWIRVVDLLPHLRSEKRPEEMFHSLCLPEGGVSIRALMDDFETLLIRKALDKCGGNKNKAAALLQMNRTTLVEKIKRYELILSGEGLKEG